MTKSEAWRDKWFTNEAEHLGIAAAKAWLAAEALLNGPAPWDRRASQRYMAHAMHHANMAGRYGQLAESLSGASW